MCDQIRRGCHVLSTVVGQVVLRPFYENPVVSYVIRLRVSLADDPNRKVFVFFTESVDNANDPLLLTDSSVSQEVVHVIFFVL